MFVAKLLGPPIFFRDSREVFFPFRKIQALLCYLLVEKRASRDVLSSLFWGDREEVRAFQSLRNALYLLRKSLPPELIRSDRQWIFVDASIGDVDINKLDGLKALAPEEKEDWFRPLLEGFSLSNAPEFEEWLREVRYRWSKRVRSVFLDLALREMAAEEWENALLSLNLLTAEDEIDEEAGRLLMRCHAARGEWGKVVECFNTLADRLENELGVLPSKETDILLKKLLPSSGDARVSAAAAGSLPEGQRIVFYGRSEEIRRICVFCSGHDSAAQCVLVEGEAGVGKTLLVEKTVPLVLSGGGLCLRCTAGPEEAKYPLLPWDDLLRSLLRSVDRESVNLSPSTWTVLSQSFPSIGARNTSIQPRNPPRLGNLLSELFSAVSAVFPLVLIFEDLQWFDDPSVDVLERFLRTSPKNVRIFITSRPEPFLRGAAVVRSVARSGNIRLLEVFLSCFSRKESMEFCTTFLPDRSFTEEELWLLFRQTEGLPLFLTEMLKAVEEGLPLQNIPRHLGDAIEGHLSCLDEETRRFLECLSIFPSGGEWNTVRGLAGMSAGRFAAVSEMLGGRNILAESLGDGEKLLLDFRHSKVREHVYDSMSEGRRRLLHDQAARLLMNGLSVRPWDDLSCSRVIFHCRKGGLRLEELDYMIRRLKYHIRLNYELFPLFDDHILKASAASLDNRFATVDDLEAARGLLQVLRKEKEGASSRFASLERAYFALRGGYFLWWGDYDQGKILVDEGLSRAEETGDRALSADCLQHLCYYSIQREKGEPLLKAAKLLSALALERGDVPLAAMARRFTGMAYLFLGQYEEAERALSDSVAQFRTLEYFDAPYTLQVLAGMCYLGEIRRRTGRTEDALALFQRCIQECEEHGLYRGLCLFYSSGALAAFDLGDHLSAREYLRRARNYFEGCEWRRANAVAWGLMALFAVRDGQEEDALFSWGEAEKLCSSLKKPSWVATCRRVGKMLLREAPASSLSKALREKGSFFCGEKT